MILAILAWYTSLAWLALLARCRLSDGQRVLAGCFASESRAASRTGSSARPHIMHATARLRARARDSPGSAHRLSRSAAFPEQAHGPVLLGHGFSEVASARRVEEHGRGSAPWSRSLLVIPRAGCALPASQTIASDPMKIAPSSACSCGRRMWPDHEPGHRGGERQLDVQAAVPTGGNGRPMGSRWRSAP